MWRPKSTVKKYIIVVVCLWGLWMTKYGCFIIIEQRSFSSWKLSVESGSLSGLSSKKSSLLIKATSYDLLSHRSVPHLRRRLEDYIKNNRTTVSCKLNDVQLHPYYNKLKATALVSFPRSGNTWLRTLVEKSTGYGTSSIYCDESLRLFRAECNQSNLFLIKTHSIEAYVMIQKRQRYYDQFIYLVRNPFDAILSYYQYDLTKNHTTKLISAKKANSSSINTVFPLLPIETVKPMVDNCLKLFHAWQKNEIPHMIVRYEDLKESPEIVLKYIKRFIVPLTMENDDNSKNRESNKLLYYFDNPHNFSSKENTMDRYIQKEDEKVACAIADDLLARDFVYKSNKYESLHSLKYFSKTAIKFIVEELLEHLCYFKYDILFKNKLNITCER
jgi:hypothetical protein